MILAICLNGYGDRLNVSPNRLPCVYNLFIFLTFNDKALVYIFPFTVTNATACRQAKVGVGRCALPDNSMFNYLNGHTND